MKELLTRQKIVALMMKAVMVRAQNLKMTWTVEVTFDEDSEKDIDTIEIEEEDWIDYSKKKHRLTLLTRWNMQGFDAGTKHTKK